MGPASQRDRPGLSPGIPGTAGRQLNRLPEYDLSDHAALRDSSPASAFSVLDLNGDGPERGCWLVVVVGLGLGVGAIVALSYRESMAHPLAATKAIAIETPAEALDNTAEMVRG